MIASMKVKVDAPVWLERAHLNHLRNDLLDLEDAAHRPNVDETALEERYQAVRAIAGPGWL